MKLQQNIQNLLNLYKSKNLKEAKILNKKLLESNPNEVFLYNIMGLILTEKGELNEAIINFKKGIEINPNYSVIYNNLGTAFKSKGELILAEKQYLKSIKLNYQVSESHNNLGNLYLDMNKYKESIKCYKEAIKINKKFFPAYYNLGNIYINLGNFNLARKYLEKSINMNKFLFTAHRNLSQIIKYSHNNKHYKLLKNIYNDSKIPDRKKVEIAFALGKASDDIQNYNDAFNYYKIGNDLRRNDLKFSIENEKDEFKKIKKVFSNKFINDNKNLLNKNTAPIFIIGMPRSGTTLIEQIISNHPNVYGGDELNYLPNIIVKHFKDIELISKSSNAEILKVGKEYINKINNLSNNSRRVTDKLPINFKWIGLIKIILPYSKIIHCTRSPEDVCLSIYKNYFVNPKLNFAYNLSELTEFYNLYHDLMIYWKNLLPDFIYDVTYEKIISKPENEIKRLLKFCNLSWNNNCVKFYKNKRPIKTASYAQARKKLYKTSVNSWKNYNKYLENFFKKLPK